MLDATGLGCQDAGLKTNSMLRAVRSNSRKNVATAMQAKSLRISYLLNAMALLCQNRSIWQDTCHDHNTEY